MRYLILFSLSILFDGFSDGSLREFYFPVDDFSESKVYKYECLSDSSRTQYWKLTFNQDSQVLETEAYTSEFRKYELFKERITDKGTEVTEFISFPSNDKGLSIPVQNTLKDVDVFRWNDEESYRYSAETDYDGNYKTVFTKDREFKGMAEISVFGEKKTSAKLLGKYKTEVVNSDETYEYSQFSYYVRGIGLVRMEKEYSDGFTEVLELTEILSLDEWKKMQ